MGAFLSSSSHVSQYFVGCISRHPPVTGSVLDWEPLSGADGKSLLAWSKAPSERCLCFYSHLSFICWTYSWQFLLFILLSALLLLLINTQFDTSKLKPWIIKRNSRWGCSTKPSESSAARFDDQLERSLILEEVEFCGPSARANDRECEVRTSLTSSTQI